MDHAHFMKCFDLVSIAHYRDHQGFRRTWYDVESDQGKISTFKFTVPQDNLGPLYITVDSYMHNIVPDSPRCLDGEGALMQFALLK